MHDPIRPSSSEEEPHSLGMHFFKKIRHLWRFLFSGGVPLSPAVTPEESPEWQGAQKGGQENFLQHLLRLRDLKAEEVMTPRADIIAFDETAKASDISPLITRSPHSSYPVFRGNLDEIIGVVRVCDLVPALVDVICKEIPFDLKHFVREGIFIAPSLPLFDVLIKMHESQSHFLFVVDEYGGIDGIITLSDVLHEFSEGFDQTPALSPRLICQQEGSYLADARLELEELESVLGSFLLPEERQETIETLGGLLSFLAGRVPSRGQIIYHKSGLQFEIKEADPRRVKWVAITQPPAPENQEVQASS